MLIRLLKLKQRREQSLRAWLVQLAADDARLAARQTAVLEARRELQAAWRALAAHSGQFTQSALEHLRSELACHERQDQSLQNQLDTLVSERLQLAQTLAEQEGLLRKNLREQEKLRVLIGAEA